MAKGIFLLIPALFIDSLQALLSLGLAGIFTTAGAGLNIIPVVGTAAAAGVIPMGILLGFVLNVAIATTFGAGLVTLLAFNGMFYPRYLFTGGGELVPVLNNLPFWTLMVLLCILQKNRELEKGGVVAGAISFTVAPTRAVMNMKENTVDLRSREARRVGLEQEEERVPQPQIGEELVGLARSRERLQDIRPSKAHA